jgi:SSS family solute:Na+ symporter
LLIPTVLSGLFIAAILGKYWFRATWQGGVASPAGGSVVAFVVNASEALTSFWGNPILPSLAGALLAGVVVSYLTRATFRKKRRSGYSTKSVPDWTLGRRK